MKSNINKTQSKPVIKEGLIDRFIDSFFDSYKKGIDKQFVNKTREKNPELAKSLDNVIANLDKAMQTLKSKKGIS
jgi:hypothetical protein